MILFLEKYVSVRHGRLMICEERLVWRRYSANLLSRWISAVRVASHWNWVLRVAHWLRKVVGWKRASIVGRLVAYLWLWSAVILATCRTID